MVELQSEVDDSHRWAWDRSGQYTTRSAYEARFWGRQVAPAADFTWKSKAPLRCWFFAWLTLRNRCWTSDRLMRRRLDQQDKCSFCDQEEESIDHILLQCVFPREVWTSICFRMNKTVWIPTSGSTFEEWCSDKHGNN